MKVRIVIIIAVMRAVGFMSPSAMAADKVDWKSLQDEAMVLYRQGNYEEAMVITQKALGIAEKDYGPEHPRAAFSRHILGELYYNKEEYTMAEPMYVQALRIFEKALGRDHLSVALVLTNMAELYLKMNRVDESTSCLTRAQGIYSMHYKSSPGQGLSK